MEMSATKLDRIDLAIMNALQKNARLSMVELARAVNLSPTPCTLRLRRLEKDGFIAGYHATLNGEKLGHDLLVFLQVTLKATGEDVLEAFNRAIRPVPEVLECHMVGGGFDYLLKVRVSDMQTFRNLLGGVIANLPMVESSHSYFVMEQVKETSALPIVHRSPLPRQRKSGQ